jgi:anaerobic dimethyl sulfoxide reductase subunit C (anchor subunit)
MLKEWPLVAFTILGQTAVGLFWSFHLPFLLRGRVPAFGWRATWLIVLGVTALLVTVAAVLSLFHLRHPFRARRALGNLRTSWLSREILFELLFLALVGIIGGLGAFRSPDPALVRGLLAAACLAGGLFLLSMTRLYMLPAVPVWKGIYTPLSFLATTLVLGALMTGVVVRAVAGPGAFALDLTTAGLVLVAAEIVLAVCAAPRHGLRGFRPEPSLRPGDAPPALLHLARLLLLTAGLVLLAIDRISGGNDIMNERGAGPVLLAAFLVILAAEAAGRIHFYGLVARPDKTASSIGFRPASR